MSKPARIATRNKKVLKPAGLLLVLVSFLFSQRLDFSQKPLNAERSRDYDARHYLIRLSLDKLAGKFGVADKGSTQANQVCFPFP